jgi:hypothetical protein
VLVRHLRYFFYFKYDMSCFGAINLCRTVGSEHYPWCQDLCYFRGFSGDAVAFAHVDPVDSCKLYRWFSRPVERELLHEIR